MKTLIVTTGCLLYISLLIAEDNISPSLAEMEKQSQLVVGAQEQQAACRAFTSLALGQDTPMDVEYASAVISRGNLAAASDEDPELHRSIMLLLASPLPKSIKDESIDLELRCQLIERLCRERIATYGDLLHELYISAYKAETLDQLNALEKICEYIHPALIEWGMLKEIHDFERSNMSKRLQRRRFYLEEKNK